jgi:acetylornithine deacetylase/succinyl-diaminopimelate desuccinylase-like protein
VLPDVRDLLSFLANDEKEPLAGAMRRASKSAPLLAPGDEKLLSRDDEANALVRTTCVTTMLSGSPQENVLPTAATATINCRILPDDGPEAIKRWLEGLVADKRVEIAYAAPPDRDASPRSAIDARLMDAVKAAVAARWPGAATFPSMDTGATDSRFLRAAGIPAYGVDTAVTSRAEEAAGRTAHGPDERTPLRWLDDGARLLRDVVTTLAR